MRSNISKAGRFRLGWRRALAVALVGIFALLARPAFHLLSSHWHDIDQRQPLEAGWIDDASRMNATSVADVWPVPADREMAEEQLAQLLRRANDENLRVSISGARHTMGGHTIYPGGLVIDMLPFCAMQLDEEKQVLHVQAGALWSDIIPLLDAHGLSVAVMQSNNSFSVGGSLSANCHGWQHGQPPIASTVEGFRLMKADGTIVSCTRTENQELFSLVLGGYGLFGIILDVDLRVVPNERYRLHQTIVPVTEAVETFDRATNSGDVAMAYARMGIAPDQFLRQVIVNVLYRDPGPSGALPEIRQADLVSIRRSLFRGSAASPYGKKLRWQAEVRLQPHLRERYYSRNQLLNEGVEVFENRRADSTDILHEYFIPRDGLVAFVESLQEIIPRHQGDLMNVTVRSIEPDRDTLLRYADQPMFSFVMLFCQPRTEAGDVRMALLAQELVEASLQAGGRYYLPYRLHATVSQFHRAYPDAKQFFALKRKYDPTELFSNQFYLKYGSN